MHQERSFTLTFAAGEAGGLRGRLGGLQRPVPGERHAAEGERHAAPAGQSHAGDHRPPQHTCHAPAGQRGQHAADQVKYVGSLPAGTARRRVFFLLVLPTD